MQILAGHVVDLEGFKLEVWTEAGPDGEVSDVFVMYGGAQLADFPFGSPNKGSEECEAAQMVAANEEVITITLPILVTEE
jgi:hypothetical protein